MTTTVTWETLGITVSPSAPRQGEPYKSWKIVQLAKVLCASAVFDA
jgi:hypothetical protein